MNALRIGAGVVGLFFLLSATAAAGQRSAPAKIDGVGCIVTDKVVATYNLADESQRDNDAQKYATEDICKEQIRAGAKIAFMDNRAIVIFCDKEGTTVAIVAHVYLWARTKSGETYSGEAYIEVRNMPTTQTAEAKR